jgi:hypothetical protein
MSLPEKIPDLAGVSVGNPDVVRVLEDALSMARAGRLVAVGVVQVTGPHQIGAVTAGSAAMEIYVGAGMMQASVLKAMTEPAKRSPILMPVRG